MILTVQRLIKRKDLETVILAMPKILQEKPNVKLVVVGEGPERERLLRLASTTGVASSVIFAGSVPESEKPSYYGAADLFLLSTLYEAFGLVLVEAMAAAKCVIASKTGAVPEIVQDQVTGFVFPPGRVQDLAVLVLRALEDDTLRTEMGLRGRERALANYSWDRITERYCAAYAQLR
jgi:glycosyltransferase involved in cell wall biosynthesis